MALDKPRQADEFERKIMNILSKLNPPASLFDAGQREAFYVALSIYRGEKQNEEFHTILRNDNEVKQ